MIEYQLVIARLTKTDKLTRVSFPVIIAADITDALEQVKALFSSGDLDESNLVSISIRKKM